MHHNKTTPRSHKKGFEVFTKANPINYCKIFLELLESNIFQLSRILNKTVEILQKCQDEKQVVFYIGGIRSGKLLITSLCFDCSFNAKKRRIICDLNQRINEAIKSNNQLIKTAQIRECKRLINDLNNQ